jgi:cation diffusion facilitator family transporter
VSLSKLAIGLAQGLAAVTADGIHSMVDASSNVVGLFAVYFAAQPADREHPYGHAKIEALAALFIGAMVGMTAVELARMSITALLEERSPVVSAWTVGIMVGTLVINVLVATFERREGRRLKSPILIADADHTFSDVLVTLGVLGSLALVKLGYPQADPILALGLIGFIVYIAIGIVKNAVFVLADSAQLDPAAVKQTAESLAGVVRVGRVRSRGLETAVFVDLAIEVDPGLSLGEAHELSHGVEQVIRKTFPEVVDVVVHIEPA